MIDQCCMVVCHVTLSAGWTLGPLDNRSYFDVLPPGWSLSSINEKVGNWPPEPEYANVTQHDKWVIPW